MPGRVSQNLPTPKCSTCNQFVPLEDLGEHICPPVLPVPKLSTPAVAALLPKRLQGRIPSPSPGSTIPSTSQSASPIRGVRANSRGLPVNGSSPTEVTFQSSSNAGSSKDLSMPMQLPHSDTRARAPSNASVNQPIHPIRPTMDYNQDRIRPATPVFAPPGQPSPLSGRGIPPFRNISVSNQIGGPPANYRGPPPDPSMPRSGTPASMLHAGNMIPPRNMGSPAPQTFSSTIGPGAANPITDSPQQSFVPPPERGIDTKTGGEAGMAGVGRRGFAAVARAAMFAAPHSRPLGPQPLRKAKPNYIDLDAISRPTETPPLSAGSGYSSHSPGPTSPLPQSEFGPRSIEAKIPRTPSLQETTPTQSVTLKPSDPITSLVSPLSSRFPFFEKFKNKIPGNSSTSGSANAAKNDPSMSSLNSPTSTPTSVARKNTSDSNASAMIYRSVTSSTNSSRHVKDIRRPISPVDSESEYGGLAYADSTDYEDNDTELSKAQSKSDSRPDIPHVLRPGSGLSYHHRSGSEHSVNSNRTGIIIGSTRKRSGHARDTSASSVSSLDGAGSCTRDRVNSSIIAQALGLSQTPPSDYGKLGGPGVGGRLRSDSSSSRRNAGPDFSEEMEKALEEAKAKTRAKKPSFGSSSQRSNLYRIDTSSSVDSSKDDNVIGSTAGGLKSHRSNTIQSSHLNSPEGKAVKLPMRSLTSPKVERDKALDGTGVKERVRKPKVCLKCQQLIDNGRWVSVDGGGVLCEKCWKKMYLPRCRRCHLSIEKQAVSSSDGQLKGKYHKECFNCDTCHKPFPDKTFYVYDGKPLCAYHYHEANDSLCSAARCGQPIEGPCAVSHSGDRYHPEHMTCEHPGYPPCKQMLSEYWEIDGRMLCERHAHSASVRGSDEDDEWSRAKKRVTRFIDLAGGGGGFGSDDGLV